MTEPGPEDRPTVHRDFDALSEGVVWLDAEGRIVDANAAAAPTLGLTRDELLGLSALDPRWYAVREDGSPWPGPEHPAMLALRTGEPQRGCVMGIASPRIGRRWISINATPQFAAESLPTEERRPAGVVATIVDVTPDIELQHRLTRRERELESGVQPIRRSEQVLDLQARYAVVDDTGLSWLGIARELLVDRLGPQDFMPGPSHRTFMTHFARVLAGESISDFAVELVDVRGQHRWVQADLAPVRDDQGNVTSVRACLQLHAPRRPEQALAARAAARDRLMLDHDLVAIVRMRNRQIVWRNPGFGRLFGYGQSAWLDLDVASLFPDRVAFEAFDSAASAALTHGASFRSTLEMRHLDGSTLWVQCSGTLFDGEHGESLWFMTDVTALRREHARALRSAELSAEGRWMQEVSRLHSQFLANVSHELHTPLNATVSCAYLLRRLLESPDLEKKNRYIDQIEASGRHLLSLVDNMLELARLDRGRLPPTRSEPMDIRLAIDDVVASLDAKACARGISVSSAIPADLPTPVMDGMRFRQVLASYLGNAIKFSKPGGKVSISVSPAPEGRLVLEVRDEGIGVSEADQQRLFRRFQQLDAGTGKAYDGLGIGLALVRQLVEAAGGRVGVRSTLGVCSVFWAEWPLEWPTSGS